MNRDADSSDDDALSTSRRCRFTTGMFLLCVAAAILIFYPDAMAHRHFSCLGVVNELLSFSLPKVSEYKRLGFSSA